MRTWNFGSARNESSRVQAVLAQVVSSMGDESFSFAFLSKLNNLLPIGCWSIYETGNNQPVMFESGSYQRNDTTQGSWNAYLQGPFLQDESLCVANTVAQRPQIAHITSQELTSPGHRERVYDQFGMTERVSVLEPRKSGGVLALNMYRYSDQPSFSDRDFELIEMMAEPLFAVVKRHIELKRCTSKTNHYNILSVGHFRDVLQNQYPGFTERELDVCARLLHGMSYEGIAADLHLSLSSVKTYRKRAFARLDINFKSELVRHYLLRNV